MHHVLTKSEKKNLEVKYFNAVKGDFIAEYMGELINQEELERRRKLYHPSCGVFMFEFKWRGKTWWTFYKKGPVASHEYLQTSTTFSCPQTRKKPCSVHVYLHRACAFKYDQTTVESNQCHES
ncbi:hypothetical protein QQF64_018758 [Cirrhinus molitorella]|uniref:Uncharacterized protein n=1 Tax=Cirrhinus molitorella TaxID=172907 RepID=A0ABR3LH16_9TELE